MFIESSSDETEDEFRFYVGELVKTIYGRSPDWLDFQVGRRVEFEGIWFREFICPAGSVGAQIHIHGLKFGLERALILFGKTGGKQSCWMIRGRTESQIDCSDLRIS
jgi:hypothetical protein